MLFCLLLLFIVCIDCAQTPLNKWQAVAMSSTGQYITGAVYEGGLFYSSDYGSTWSQTLYIDSRWFSIAMSSTGQYQMVTSTNSSQCAVSFDYGQSWTVNYACTGGLTTYSYGFRAAMDYTGQYRSVAMISTATSKTNNDYIFQSSNFGTTYARYAPASISNFLPYAVGISGDGQYRIFGNYNGALYYSTNYGASFTRALNGGGSTGWTSVALSYNGSIAVASSFMSGLYRSTDYGVTWEKALSGYFIAVVCESKGTVWYATDTYFLYISTNAGITFTKVTTAPQSTDFLIQDIATSSGNNGATVAIAGYGKCIYLSYNRGVTWTDCVDTRAPTFAPTTIARGPTVSPTRAPSGPTMTPSSVLRPTFRPSTLAPTANTTKDSQSDVGKIVSKVPFSLSFSSMSTTNQIAVAVVIVLVICCCCVPACYFMYRRNKSTKKKGGKKQKGKMHNGLLVEGDGDDEDGDVETVQIGKNGKILGSSGGVFGGGAAAGPTKTKDPTAAMAARKKKKKNAPPPPPRHKKKRHRDGDDDGGEGDGGGGDDGGDGDGDGGGDGGGQADAEEDTVEPTQPPSQPAQQRSGKLVAKKGSFHSIPRPAGPPTDLGESHKQPSSKGSGTGGFLASLSTKSKAASQKYNTSSSVGVDDESDALIPPSADNV